jgi:hypothetical protein
MKLAGRLSHQVLRQSYDLVQHFVASGEHSFIAESHHLITRCGQQPGALFILFDRFIVYIAIDFNDETEFGATEINHKGTDWMLAAELHAVEATVSQNLPELNFSGCLVLSQIARRKCHWMRAGRHSRSFSSRDTRAQSFDHQSFSLPMERGAGLRSSFSLAREKVAEGRMRELTDAAHANQSGLGTQMQRRTRGHPQRRGP